MLCYPLCAFCVALYSSGLLLDSQKDTPSRVSIDSLSTTLHLTPDLLTTPPGGPLPAPTHAQHPSEPSSADPLAGLFWDCPVCTCRNPVGMPSCDACGHSSGASAAAAPVNWPCPQCTFLNPPGG
eukprot:RCo016014